MNFEIVELVRVLRIFYLLLLFLFFFVSCKPRGVMYSNKTDTLIVRDTVTRERYLKGKIDTFRIENTKVYHYNQDGCTSYVKTFTDKTVEYKPSKIRYVTKDIDNSFLGFVKKHDTLIFLIMIVVLFVLSQILNFIKK